MPGTLLAYDAAFPRAAVRTGPILNSPSADELRANGYPAPHRLLPIPLASNPESYYTRIAAAAASMAQLDRLILLGHGRVVSAVTVSRYDSGHDRHHHRILGHHGKQRRPAACDQAPSLADRAG